MSQHFLFILSGVLKSQVSWEIDDEGEEITEIEEQKVEKISEFSFDVPNYKNVSYLLEIIEHYNYSFTASDCFDLRVLHSIHQI